MIVVGAHRREVPHGARAPVFPLLRVKAAAVDAGDPRLPEDIDVLELVHGSIRGAVPAAVFPGRVLGPDSAVVEVEPGLAAPLFDQAADQFHASLGGVLAAADVVVLEPPIDGLLAAAQIGG